MTWAPHQERFPRTIDGNGFENGQHFSGPGMTTCPAVWLLPPGPSSCDHPSQINRGMILSFKPDLFCVAADLIAALVAFEWGFAAFAQV